MELKEFFSKTPRFALAFSGGVDSSYLMYAAKNYGCEIKAYFVKTPFQPQFELDDAKKMAYFMSVPMVIEAADIMSDTHITDNPPDRCYYCKTAVFQSIAELARADGFDIVCDGTNATDDSTERSGMRALEEMGIVSPLRLCGLTKSEVRRLSREAALFTHDKPSYACLATRIPTGRPITTELLTKVHDSEHELHGLGFTDFRIRLIGECANIQVPENQIRDVIAKRKKILETLKPYYKKVLLDLKPRRTEE